VKELKVESKSTKKLRSKTLFMVLVLRCDESRNANVTNSLKELRTVANIFAKNDEV
jgi:hypothetical protein